MSKDNSLQNIFDLETKIKSIKASEKGDIIKKINNILIKIFEHYEKYKKDYEEVRKYEKNMKLLNDVINDSKYEEYEGNISIIKHRAYTTSIGSRYSYTHPFYNNFNYWIEIINHMPDTKEIIYFLPFVTKNISNLDIISLEMKHPEGINILTQDVVPFLHKTKKLFQSIPNNTLVDINDKKQSFITEMLTFPSIIKIPDIYNSTRTIYKICYSQDLNNIHNEEKNINVIYNYFNASRRNHLKRMTIIMLYPNHMNEAGHMLDPAWLMDDTFGSAYQLDGNLASAFENGNNIIIEAIYNLLNYPDFNIDQGNSMFDPAWGLSRTAQIYRVPIDFILGLWHSPSGHYTRQQALAEIKCCSKWDILQNILYIYQVYYKALERLFIDSKLQGLSEPDGGLIYLILNYEKLEQMKQTQKGGAAAAGDAGVAGVAAAGVAAAGRVSWVDDRRGSIVPLQGVLDHTGTPASGRDDPNNLPNDNEKTEKFKYTYHELINEIIITILDTDDKNGSVSYEDDMEQLSIERYIDKCYDYMNVEAGGITDIINRNTTLTEDDKEKLIYLIHFMIYKFLKNMYLNTHFLILCLGSIKDKIIFPGDCSEEEMNWMGGTFKPYEWLENFQTELWKKINKIYPNKLHEYFSKIPEILTPDHINENLEIIHEVDNYLELDNYQHIFEDLDIKDLDNDFYKIFFPEEGEHFHISIQNHLILLFDKISNSRGPQSTEYWPFLNHENLQNFEALPLPMHGYNDDYHDFCIQKIFFDNYINNDIDIYIVNGWTTLIIEDKIRFTNDLPQLEKLKEKLKDYSNKTDKPNYDCNNDYYDMKTYKSNSDIITNFDTIINNIIYEDDYYIKRNSHTKKIEINESLQVAINKMKGKIQDKKNGYHKHILLVNDSKDFVEVQNARVAPEENSNNDFKKYTQHDYLDDPSAAARGDVDMIEEEGLFSKDAILNRAFDERDLIKHMNELRHEIIKKT